MDKFWICILIICLSLSCPAQDSGIDSLEYKLSISNSDTNTLYLYLEILSRIYQTDFPKTIDYATKALDLSNELKNYKGQMEANYFLGVGHFLSSQEKLAINFIKKALSIAQLEVKDVKSMSDCHNLLGTTYHKIEEIDLSLHHFFESIKLSEQIGDQDRVGTTYNNIGEIYNENNEPEKAIKYYKNALSIFKRENNHLYSAFIYNNISEVLTDPDSSVILLHKALEIFKNEKYIDGVGQVSVNLASNYLKLEDYDKAYKYLNEAKDIFELESHYYKPGLIDVYLNLALIEGENNNLSVSKEWIDKSISMAEDIDDKIALRKNYEKYSEFLESKSMYRDALSYYKLAAVVKDSLFDQAKAEELANSETKYQSELKERTIAERELELEVQTRQKNRILFGGIILLSLLSGIFIYFRYRLRLRRHRAELNLELEKMQANRLRELDQAKSVFFSNISHEFRTPLTLILGPLKQIKEGTLKGNFNKYIEIMIRNGERLMKLVNQLMDLSKLESGKMKLDTQTADIVKTVKAMAYSFESIAERREIVYEVIVPNQGVLMNYDVEKVEHILINLLSNAFKYTSEKDKVTIEMKLKSSQKKGSFDIVQIEIIDSGMGISKAQLPHVFERFYRASNESDLQASTGIGLALTKELVELQGGEINVISEENVGTTFTFTLPIENPLTDIKSLQSEQKLFIPAIDIVEDGHLQDVALNDDSNPLILVAEDNQDVRSYIKDQLKMMYRIVEAQDGEEGLTKALEIIPDLIISDVMMPNMNGIRFCQELKKNEKTSHIPVILLTAKVEKEDKFEGLQSGADVYLMKPFDAKELKLRISNLIEQRKRIIRSFGSDFKFHPSTIEISSIDEKFLSNVKSAIEDFIDDDTFSVVDLGKIVGMSRSQLHRKLKAITNQSPNQLIRGMRLLRAKDLLEKKAGNASEIAYMVGFSSLAYFSKCFRDHFGYSPSDI